jgi:hypothetical protein
MSDWIRLLGVALGLGLAACGNGTFIISVNSGVIVNPPSCRTDGGQFELQPEGGLVVLVVITSTTHIVVASGGTGRCSDLSAGTPVQVAGHKTGDHIVASSITVD